jgi:hypothetical protein
MTRVIREKFDEAECVFAENTKERTIQRMVNYTLALVCKEGKDEKVSLVTSAAMKKVKKILPQFSYKFEGLKNLYRLAKTTEEDTPIPDSVIRLVLAARGKKREQTNECLSQVSIERDK